LFEDKTNRTNVGFILKWKNQVNYTFLLRKMDGEMWKQSIFLSSSSEIMADIFQTLMPLQKKRIYTRRHKFFFIGGTIIYLIGALTLNRLEKMT
jgi:hypothetical protein